MSKHIYTSNNGDPLVNLEKWSELALLQQMTRR